MIVPDGIRALFSPSPDIVYLDAATYGLPPRLTAVAMQEALASWQAGIANWHDWERDAESARTLFAGLIGATPEEIALTPSASVGVGTVAASLRAGDEVVVPDDEFTSVLFPFLVAERDRGVMIRQVPFESLSGAIDDRTSLVAFSLVQSQSGRRAPLTEICHAARSRGARVMVDATQAVPFVTVADAIDSIDYLVCAAYKHLLCPRGVAFLYVHRRGWDELAPLNANWRATDRPHARYYGGPLTLAVNAARFDVSLAWLTWVGARVSLGLLDEWRRDGALERVLDLSRRLAAHLRLPPPASSIVTVPIANADTVNECLRGAGIRGAVRAGTVRLSPHVYNTIEDVDRAASVLSRVIEVPPTA